MLILNDYVRIIGRPWMTNSETGYQQSRHKKDQHIDICAGISCGIPPVLTPRSSKRECIVRRGLGEEQREC